MSNQTVTVMQVSGTNSFTIERKCDRSQLLVTLCKNGTDWLSPVGWVKSEKGTLLDCTAKNNGKADLTEVEIPAEYASGIKTGDTLSLNCYELDLDAELKWKAQSSKSSGLFGLLGGAKAANNDADLGSDTERRAKAAELEAQNVREQMQRAQKAKEDAQRRAAEAARLAQEARVAEEAQIAEMEKTAAALAEAEQRQKDEQERLEQERRAEELRRQEAARLAEEARQKELERRRLAALREERKLLTTELEKAETQRVQAEDLLSTLSMDLRQSDLDMAEKKKVLDTAQTKFEKLSNKAGTKAKSFEKAQLEFNAAQDATQQIKNQIDAHTHKQAETAKQIEHANTAYATAQKLAEEAIAKATKMKEELAAVNVANTAINTQLKTANQSLKSAQDHLGTTQINLDSTKSVHESAAQKARSAQVQFEANSKEFESAAQKSEATKTDLANIQSHLETLIERELTTKAAIALVDSGSDIEHVRAMASGAPMAGEFTSSKAKIESAKKALAGTNADVKSKAASKFTMPSLSRFRKSAEARETKQEVVIGEGIKVIGAAERTSKAQFSKAQAKLSALKSNLKSPKISLPARAVALKESAEKTLEKSSELAVSQTEAAEETTKENVVRFSLAKMSTQLSEESKSRAAILLASAATLAIVGVIGYAAVNLSSNSPVQQTAERENTAAVLSTPAIENPAAAADTPAGLPGDLPTLEPKADIEAGGAPEDLAEDTPQADLTEDTPQADLSDTQSPEFKAPKVKAVAALPAAKPPVAKLSASTPPVAQRDVKAEAKPESPALEPSAVVMDIESKLSDLGFNPGTIDGFKSVETEKAISEYKLLFGLEDNAHVTSEFLASLKEASIQRAASLNVTPNVSGLAPELQTVDVTPVSTQSISVDSQLRTIIIDPPVTTSYPISQPSERAALEAAPEVPEISAPSIAAPIEPTQPVQSVSITPVGPSVLVEPDVIVEAKRVKPLRGDYPSAALRRGFEEDVSVKISYDIDSNGKVINSKIVEISQAGTHTARFEKAGLDAVKTQRFSPKTLNGEPVLSRDHSNTIKFTVE